MNRFLNTLIALGLLSIVALIFRARYIRNETIACTQQTEAWRAKQRAARQQR